MTPARVAVTPLDVTMPASPAPSAMLRAELSVLVTSRMPAVLASPRASPPAAAPRSPSAAMLTVLNSVTAVPPE
jgi:hypothetical protein